MVGKGLNNWKLRRPNTPATTRAMATVIARLRRATPSGQILQVAFRGPMVARIFSIGMALI